MKIGATTINLDALSSVTKEQFIASNKGVIFNVEVEADKLSRYFKQEVVQVDVQVDVQVEETISLEPTKSKKRRRK